MFEGLTRTVDGIVDGDVGLLCDSEIRESFIAARREIDRLEAHAATLLAAIDHRTIPLGDGASSTAVWVQWQTGQRVADARVSLQVGLGCERLPLTAKA